MNIYAIIIVVTLVATTLIDAVSAWLNLRALSPVLPEGFADVYDASDYRRSQEYTRARTHFGFVTAAFDLAVILIFWFLGGFEWLDGIVRGWGVGMILAGIAYVCILVSARGVIGLPFSVYATFVIEERFGFNRTTLRTWIADRFKGIMLAILLGVPLLAGILWFFDAAGHLAWMYCWMAVAAFMLTLQYLAPTLIMPLFNRFSPLPDGELRRAIISYADLVHYPLAGIFVMDGSRRSSKSNAFFTGFGRNKRIVLFDTLVEQHGVPELVAILAHEIGHFRKKHILVSTITGIALAGVEFWLLSLFLKEPALSEAFFMHEPSIYTGLIFFGLLFTPVNYLLDIARSALSRRHEFQADRYAAVTTGNPGALVRALKKLAAANLSNLTPHPFHVFLHDSHPPLAQRIDTITTAGTRVESG